jgi:hypothetical protein
MVKNMASTHLKWPNLGKAGAVITACFVVITSMTLGKHLFVILAYGWPAYSDGLRIVHSYRKGYARLSNGDNLNLLWATIHVSVVAALCLALMFAAEKLSGVVPRNLVIAVYAVMALAVFVALK